MSGKIKSVPETEFEKKLIQDESNVNVAFYVHIKEFDNSVSEEIEKRINDVFYFLKDVDWNFDSFGMEKAGSRGKDMLCYFILRSSDVSELQKLFVEHLADYDNVINITCSVAKYKKVEEEYFTLTI